MRSIHDITQVSEVIRTCFSAPAAARLPAICAPWLGSAARTVARRVARSYVKENLVGGRKREGNRAYQGQTPRSEAWLNADLAET